VQRRMEVAARKEAGYKKATGFSCFLFFFPPACATHVDGDAVGRPSCFARRFGLTGDLRCALNRH
jgi:hypothetical protein